MQFVVSQVEQAIRSNPNNLDIIAFTGFDFIGGGFRNNAATIFVTQKHWDDREVTAAQLVGELFGKAQIMKMMIKSIEAETLRRRGFDAKWLADVGALGGAVPAAPKGLSLAASVPNPKYAPLAGVGIAALVGGIAVLAAGSRTRA